MRRTCSRPDQARWARAFGRFCKSLRIERTVSFESGFSESLRPVRSKPARSYSLRAAPFPSVTFRSSSAAPADTPTRSEHRGVLVQPPVCGPEGRPTSRRPWLTEVPPHP